VLEWYLDTYLSFQDNKKLMARSTIFGKKVALFEALNGEQFVDF